MPLVSLPFLLLVSPPRLARPRRLALFGTGNEGAERPHEIRFPPGAGGPFPPRSHRLALFLAGKRGGRTPALALLPEGRARGFPSFKRRRPAGRGGSFPAALPQRLALFRGRRNEGTERLHELCLPMGGREAFHLSKGVAPLDAGGPFPPRPRRPALYGSRGKKEPNVCPGRASSAGNGGSRRAGRVHSTFQAVSSRRAQRMNFR